MASEEFVTVRVAQGSLRGRKALSKAGGRYYSFQGIPYAKPPVGPLRFKDPQPADPWIGVRDALKETEKCTQFDMGFDGEISPTKFAGSEDCLYLNVYSPESASLGGGGEKLPVMVWIHGGGFVGGSGSTRAYGPDYMMTENVILVTINYRLGVFGFLYLGDAAAPGNYGLKDQVAALRWVRANAQAFGGDADNVTVFGESAGGASVHYLLLSPLTKGLFRRAIAQSGTALCPWARQFEPVQTARRLARALGCSADDPQAIVDFLRAQDHLALCQAAVQDAAFPREKRRLLSLEFVPSPEVPVEGYEMFFPAPPQQLVDEGRYHAVPFMTGVTSCEAKIALYFNQLNDDASRAKMDADFEDRILMETRLPVEEGVHSFEAARELRRFFLDGKPLSADSLPRFIDMISDLWLGEPMHYAVERMAKDSKANIYTYVFDLEGDVFDYTSPIKEMLNVTVPENVSGTIHGMELGYLFRAKNAKDDPPADHPDAISRRRVLRLWTNFAKTGMPTPSDDPLLGVRWEPYTRSQRRFLHIGPQLQLCTDLYKERFQFWEDFYKRFGQ